MVDNVVAEKELLYALRDAAKAVIAGKERPGERKVFGIKRDFWAPYHEVEDKLLDRLESILNKL
jgi:hypothetical protein